MGVWRYSHGQISSLCPWLVIEEVRKERKLETKLIWCRIAAFSCSRPLCTMAVTLAWSSSEKAKNKQEPWLHQHPWCGQMDISIFFLRLVATPATKSQPFSPYYKFWHRHLCSWRGILGDNLQASWKLCWHMGKNGILPNAGCTNQGPGRAMHV